MPWRHRNVFSISHTILLVLLPAALVVAQPGQSADPAGISPGIAGDVAGDLLTRIANYQSALAELDGNYDASSVELLISLAEARIEAGQLVDAGSSFNEALQAMRINEGLASENQLRLLSRYNELLVELQDWEQLDTNLHMILDISRRLYSAVDERSVQAATVLASWKIKAYQSRQYRPDGNRSILEATEIYRGLLGRLSLEQASPSRRAAYLSGLGLAHFYAAQHVAGIPVNEFQPTASQNLSPQYCVPLILSVDGAMPAQTACSDSQIRDPEYYASQQRSKNNAVRRHLGNMRQSFVEAIRLVEADSRSSREDRVKAILNLADAYLLAEDYQRARSQYARAWEFLSDGSDESTALRNRLMGRAVRAFDGVLDDVPTVPELRRSGPTGTVSFDVTEHGAIVNISLSGDARVQLKENVGAIAMLLEQSRYRPRIDDGRPVRSRVTVAAKEL